MKKKSKFFKRHNDYRHTLTSDVLENLGFKKAIGSLLKNEVWRISVPYYHYQIQVEIMDLPIDNGNCGILSLYMPEEKDVDVSNGYGKRKYVTFKEQTIPVAYHVHTPERLYQLITVLTYRCA